MSDQFDNDEVLKRLQAEDPAATNEAEAPGEREAIRSRTAKLIEEKPRHKGHTPLMSGRSRLVALGVLGIAVVGVALALVIGGSGSGPAPALAISKGDRWITLKIEDPSASDAQMNSELAAAGIDSVRVWSVPGPKYAVGNWAGDAEFGLDCQGGVHYFGGGVDIPAAHPLSPANRHSAENLIDLRIPHSHGSAVLAEPAGTPYSRSTLRVDTHAVNDPHNAAMILVPIRAKTPDDGPDAHHIGVDQMVALGGVFARYGQAIQDGHARCADFGLKPVPPPPPFPPNTHDWLDLHVADTKAGAEEMTSAIKAAGINAEVRLVPAQGIDVGRYLGLIRTPPLPPRYPGVGNRVDIRQHDSTGHYDPEGRKLALRIAAFTAFGDDRWVFYLGRTPAAGEKPEVLTTSGPEDAEKALKAGCPGAATIQAPNGGAKHCISSPSFQLPAP